MLWLMILVISFTIEITTLSLVSIWFSVGALIAILLKTMGVLLTGQIIGFIVTSALTFLLFRPILMKHIKTPKVKTNMDRNIGKTGEVIKEISPLAFGQVKIDGQIWTGKSKDGTYIKEGTIIEVVGIEGVKLVVENKRGNAECHGSF